MKFAYTALLGAASANFLQELDSTAAAATAPEDATEKAEWAKYKIESKLTEVGGGLCQPSEGLVVWDLKGLDAKKSVDYIGASQAGFSDNTFGVELCESSFDYTKMPNYKVGESEFNILAPETPLKHGNAYWSSETADGTTFTP